MAYGLLLVRDAMPRGIALSSSGLTVREEISCYVSPALSRKVMFCLLRCSYPTEPGYLSRHSDSLRAVLSGIRIPALTRRFLVQPS